jgi:hypothetical protein
MSSIWNQAFFAPCGGCQCVLAPSSATILAGKRQSCTNPLKYCFVVITIYALAINLLDINLTWVMR